MDFSPRQTVALKTVVTNPGCDAKTVAEALAAGSDTRGAAQTLRTLSREGYIVRDGEAKPPSYHATAEGRKAVAAAARS